MVDIYCKKCGEPWDLAEIIDALNRRGDMTKEEAEKILRGEGCPCCGFGKYCPSCKGTGKCPECDGMGIEKFKDWITNSYIERTCTWCSGTGKCSRCSGTGKLKENHDGEYYSGLVEADGEINALDYV